MSYQVFARKYRPQTFDDVVGQDHIVRTLKNAIDQNRLAHAYLFVGPRGTGKTSTARIIAKALNCKGGPKVDFDPQEDVCIEIAEGRSMDVIEIDGASNNGVDHIRDLRENVRFAPARGQFKIYIIDEVHMLTPGAFNALLKTLEEPPEHVKFIFATTEPQKVLPTILSRCQRFDLKRIAPQLIAKHLKWIAEQEQIKLEDSAAAAIAKGADGGMRDAESMLDQLVAFCEGAICEDDVLSVFGFSSQSVVADLAGHVLKCSTSEALGIIQQQADEGKDLLKLLGDLISHLRNVLVQSVDPGRLDTELPAEIAEQLTSQAELQPQAKFIAVIDALAASESSMKWAPNKRLHFEIGLIKAVQLLESASLDEVLDTLSSLRDGNPISPAGGKPGSGSADPTPDSAAAKTKPTKSRATATQADTPESPKMSLREQVEQELAAKKPQGNPPKSAASSPTPDAQASNSPATATGTAVLEEVVEQPKTEPAPQPAKQTIELPHEQWVAVIHGLRESPLVHACLLKFQPLGIEEDTLVLGYPPEQRMNAQMLEESARISQLKEVLKTITGKDLEIATRAVEGLHVEPVEVAASPAEKDPLEEFRNDPLIQKALDLFKGELESGGSRSN